MTQHVVITGGSAGVGLAAALEFAGRGCAVTLLARQPDRLRQAVEMLRERGGESFAVPTDVAEADAVEAAAAAAEKAHGPIDTWVNNAMATVFAPVSELSPQELRRVTDVTYHGQVNGTMAALRRMRPRNRGTIVNVNSALGYHGIPLQAAYCGAKFATRGFTESVIDELEHEGSRVRVSLVVLPAVNTPQFDWARNRLPCRPRPVAPVFAPEVAARGILEAADRAPRELLIGGSSLQLVAGSATAPGLVDRMLARSAVSGQQTDEPAGADREGNLFEPVAGDARAAGRFASEARGTAPTVPAAAARAGAGIAAVVVAAGVGALGFMLGRRRG